MEPCWRKVILPCPHFQNRKKKFAFGPLVVHTCNLSTEGGRGLRQTWSYISSSMPAKATKWDHLKMNKSVKWEKYVRYKNYCLFVLDDVRELGGIQLSLLTVCILGTDLRSSGLVACLDFLNHLGDIPYGGGVSGVCLHFYLRLAECP